MCLLDVNPQLKVSSFPAAPGQTRVLVQGADDQDHPETQFTA